MTLPAWHEEAIAKKHDRKAFDCGQHDLNRFLQHYARQAHEHGASKTYVAVDDADEKTVYGYYTLSPAPARLAVSKSLKGPRSWRSVFLAVAARRCMRASQLRQRRLSAQGAAAHKR